MRNLIEKPQPLAVLAQDAPWRFVNKPAGLPVFPPHADPSGDCVLRRLEAQGCLGPGPWPQGFEGGLAHRLDTATSGLVAFAPDPEALATLRHPRTVMTFSDSGAHVSLIMDSSIHTHLLAYWVREKQAFTLEAAVRQITYDTATLWGLHDRGLVREGMAADLVVLDPDTVGARMPEMKHDLPAGARRLKQTADGIMHTIVGGQILLTNNEHTGALPGRFIRAGAR